MSGVGGGDVHGLSVAPLGPYRVDHGTRPLEQVGRRVDLDLHFLVRVVVPLDVRTLLRVAAGRDHPAVGQQQGDRVVHACHRGRRQRPPGICPGVVHLGFVGCQRRGLVPPGAASDQHGPVRKQGRVQVLAALGQGSGRPVRRMRLGEVRDVDVLDGVAAARRTPDDHDPLGLRGREEHAGALVAGADLAQTGYWCHDHRITGRIEAQRVGRPVIHVAAGVADGTVREQIQMCVQRQSAELLRRSADLPGVRPGEEGLDADVTPPRLRQPGGDQHPAVAEADQAGIPAPVLHRSTPRPLLDSGIKHHGVRPAGEPRTWVSENQGASR